MIRRALLLGLCLAAPAAVAQMYNPGYAPGFTPGLHVTIPAAPGSYDSDAQAIFNSFTTPPTEARKTTINTAVVSMKSCGIWAKQDVLWVLAAANQQAAFINWKNPGTKTLVANGTVNFTADRGYTRAGTGQYLDGSYNPATFGGVFTQNSAHVSQLAMINGSSTSPDVLNSGGTTQIIGRTTTASSGRVNFTTANVSGSATSTIPALSTINRSTSSTLTLFRSGAQDFTASAYSSSAVASQNITIGASSGAGDRQTGWVSIGSSFALADATCENNVVKAYMSDLGVTIQ